MNIVIITNDNNESEWVKMDKNGYFYTVYHYENNDIVRKCKYDDFFQAVERLKEWQSYFE